MSSGSYSNYLSPTHIKKYKELKGEYILLRHSNNAEFDKTKQVPP